MSGISISDSLCHYFILFFFFLPTVTCKNLLLHLFGTQQENQQQWQQKQDKTQKVWHEFSVLLKR